VAGQKDPLPLTSRMELFHRACLDAVAAAAGVTSTPTASGTDHDKTDTFLTVLETNRSLLLQAQLKATGDLEDRDGFVHFDLDIETYNKLRDAHTSSTPRLLVVMDLPGEPDGWTICDHDCLRMHRRVFWTHLYDAPKVANTTKKRLSIPHDRLLTASSLVPAMKTVHAAYKAALGGT